MAHLHPCKHCDERFICGEDSAECFERFIVCHTCWWRVEFRHFAVFCGLLAAAVLMTLLLFGHHGGNR